MSLTHVAHERIKWIAHKLEELIRDLDVPQPEEPGFAIGFNSHTENYYVQVGENYAGYFEDMAVIPVYLDRQFAHLETALFYMESLIREAEED